MAHGPINPHQSSNQKLDPFQSETPPAEKAGCWTFLTLSLLGSISDLTITEVPVDGTQQTNCWSNRSLVARQRRFITLLLQL